MQFSDFALDIHIELLKINTTGLNIKIYKKDSLSKLFVLKVA